MMTGEALLQPATDLNAAQLLRLLVPLGVFGAFAARLVLRWAAGQRPFSGQTDDTGSTFALDDHGGCGSDHGGGDCDSGH